MNGHGPTQCATKVAACPRVGKNMQGLTQYSSFYTKTNQSTDGQPMLDKYTK